MKALTIVKRHLEISRPVEKNMWNLFDATITNLAFRGTTLTIDEYIQLESDYNAYVNEGRWGY